MHCGPISRILYPCKPGLHHLSGTGVATGLYLPTPPDSPGGELSEQLISRLRHKRRFAGIGMYVAFQPTRFIRLPNCSGTPCALTARFHPYPDESGRLFSATLSVSRRSGNPPVRWCGALRCPDFPPRHESRSDGVARSARQSYNELARVEVRSRQCSTPQVCMSSKERSERWPLPFCSVSVQWSVVEVCSQRLPERRNTCTLRP